jgi:hypothetical protein
MYTTTALIVAPYLQADVALSFAPAFGRSPLNDIDLSASTDFEDGLIVAADSLFLAEQDASVWADGTGFYAWRPAHAGGRGPDVVIR